MNFTKSVRLKVWKSFGCSVLFVGCFSLPFWICCYCYCFFFLENCEDIWIIPFIGCFVFGAIVGCVCVCVWCMYVCAGLLCHSADWISLFFSFQAVLCKTMRAWIAKCPWLAKNVIILLPFLGDIWIKKDVVECFTTAVKSQIGVPGREEKCRESSADSVNEPQPKRRRLHFSDESETPPNSEVSFSNFNNCFVGMTMGNCLVFVIWMCLSEYVW